MSETFPEEWANPEGTPPAAPEPPPARQFTAEELAEASRQIAAQNVGVTGPEVGSPVDLGLHALAAGAEATEVDTAAMLRAIKQLSAKVAALEAEKRLSNAPAVVTYAHALHDHLAVKATQHPTVQADPDYTWGQAPREDGQGGRGVLGATGRLVASAEAAADTGNPGTIAEDAGKVTTWVVRHARHFPHLDYSYVLELAEDVAQAAVKLAA